MILSPPNRNQMSKITLSDEHRVKLLEAGLFRPKGQYCRVALEYMAMMPEQKTWFLLNNPKPYIPSHYGPRNVKVRTGPMYEILARKWARQRLNEQAI